MKPARDLVFSRADRRSAKVTRGCPGTRRQSRQPRVATVEGEEGESSLFNFADIAWEAFAGRIKTPRNQCWQTCSQNIYEAYGGSAWIRTHRVTVRWL